ncbi:polysaccharide biosynthesis/export family protein [Pontibacter liquoris]|uniref:polysaccharide biosynthesis/export family protein n=1 Tax=Pontibacter liquoris TaxID=2905677 RepID=UPI001FA6D782|nr:polysaccharide biosynthesis/export family protein [Pontibacter liquoris]
MKPCNTLYPLYILLIVLLFTNCASRKGALYFENVQTSEYNGNLQNLEPVIQNNDLLSIVISSSNPAASEYFNTFNISDTRSITATNSITQAVGYLVDQEGNVQLPFLGKLKASGLTKKALNDKIRDELINRKLLIEPVVDIRFLNYKVSVLGEVAHPSVLTVPNEKITLLEALGLAGDLTIYANRDNVLLIREEEGKKKLIRINLTTDELFTSPYYNLKSNDIIYVEPNKAKVQSSGNAKLWLPVVFSGLSVVVIALDRLTN